MAISMKSLKTMRCTSPPRVLIYGPPGQGKTTLAAEFPNAVFLQVEDGSPADPDFKAQTFGILKSFTEVVEAINALYAEAHDFQTVVVDSLDKLEPLLWEATCARQVPPWIILPEKFQEGVKAATMEWRDFLTGLDYLRNERSMNVVMLAHSEVKPFNDPRSATYDRYEIRLDKRALALVSDEVDMIVFLNNEYNLVEEKKGFHKDNVRRHAEGGITRWMYVENRGAYTAKNRYGMKAKFPYIKGKGYATFAPYFPSVNGGNQPSEPAEAEAVAA